MLKLCVWEGHNEIEFRQQQKREERNKKKRRKERRVTRICVLRLFFFFSVTLNIYLAGKLHQVRSPCFASNCGSQGCCQVSASSIFFVAQASARSHAHELAETQRERERQTDRQRQRERFLQWPPCNFLVYPAQQSTTKGLTGIWRPFVVGKRREVLQCASLPAHLPT